MVSSLRINEFTRRNQQFQHTIVGKQVAGIKAGYFFGKPGMILKHLHFVAYFGARFYCGMLFLRAMPLEEAFLKYKQCDHTNRYGGIGDIKDWTEKLKLLPANKGHPGWIRGFYNGEIKHVHYPAVQETCIAVRRKNFRYL